MLLPERPDIVREPIQDDRQWQERSADDYAERKYVQRQLVHHRGLWIRSRLGALPRDRRATVEVRRDAGQDHHRHTHRDQRRATEIDEHIQPGPLRHVRPDRSAEQVGI